MEVDAKDASKVREIMYLLHFFTHNLVQLLEMSPFSLIKRSYTLFHSFRKILNLTFTLRKCTGGWPAAQLKKTPSSPAFGSWTSATWGRRWSLWMSVLSCWKVWKRSIFTVATPYDRMPLFTIWLHLFKGLSLSLKPISVDPSVYWSCLRYSDLAPKWESKLHFGLFYLLIACLKKKVFNLFFVSWFVVWLPVLNSSLFSLFSLKLSLARTS